MAQQLIPFFQGTFVGATATNLFALPATSNGSPLKKLTFCNTSGATVTLKVYLVPSGIGAPVDQYLIRSKSLAPSETYECFEAENHFLAPGDSIWATAGTGAVVSARGSGIIVTN